MSGTAEEVLTYLIELLEYSLNELNGFAADAFSLGEKYAYVECLEIIQKWSKAREKGLDYEIEDRFPID